MQRRKENTFGAHAWHCRSKVGTARAHFLNSLSLHWPTRGICLQVKVKESAATSQGGTQHQCSLSASAMPGTSTTYLVWDGQCHALTKWHSASHCLLNYWTQVYLCINFFLLFFNVLQKNPTKYQNHHFSQENKGKGPATSSHMPSERSWSCSH